MNNSSFNLSLNDTTILRNLILEHPDLPVLIFCGEESWQGEYGYNQADASFGSVEKLTLYNNRWMNEDDYEETLRDNLADEEEYKYMTDEEYDEMIQKRIEETEFVEAIVIWMG